MSNCTGKIISALLFTFVGTCAQHHYSIHDAWSKMESRITRSVGDSDIIHTGLRECIRRFLNYYIHKWDKDPCNGVVRWRGSTKDRRATIVMVAATIIERLTIAHDDSIENNVTRHYWLLRCSAATLTEWRRAWTSAASDWGRMVVEGWDGRKRTESAKEMENERPRENARERMPLQTSTLST